MTLEEQFEQQEAKRISAEKARIAVLEQYRESLVVQREADALEKEVLTLIESQRVRAQTKLSELIQLRSTLALTDAELVSLEKQYLALLNKELEH